MVSIIMSTTFFTLIFNFFNNNQKFNEIESWNCFDKLRNNLKKKKMIAVHYANHSCSVVGYYGQLLNGF
jgi:hypothetical protein